MDIIHAARHGQGGPVRADGDAEDLRREEEAMGLAAARDLADDDAAVPGADDEPVAVGREGHGVDGGVVGAAPAMRFSVYFVEVDRAVELPDGDVATIGGVGHGAAG